jgi:hypothetical protein
MEQGRGWSPDRAEELGNASWTVARATGLWRLSGPKVLPNQGGLVSPAPELPAQARLSPCSHSAEPRRHS